MENEKIDIEKTINHWIVTSDDDYETMIHLYESKDFHWSLFIGHMKVIRRLLIKNVHQDIQQNGFLILKN